MNHLPLTAEQHAFRRALYNKGYSDSKIGREVGVCSRVIFAWRHRHGLPSHGNILLRMDAAKDAARMLLYQMHYSDRRIAREQHVRWSVIWKWRMRRNLPAHGLKRRNWQRADLSRDTTLDRIRWAIGRALPPDIRDDAVSSLYLAVLDGTVELAKIEAEAKRYGNRVINQFANKFGDRSLDEELGDGDGFRMIDMIRDERSSSWLEEMGATVW